MRTPKRWLVVATFLLTACSSGTPTTPGTGSVIQVIQQQPPPQVVQLPLPSANANPTAALQGPDSAVWIAESAAGKLARVTEQGAFSEYAFKITHSPTFLALGPGTN